MTFLEKYTPLLLLGRHFMNGREKGLKGMRIEDTVGNWRRHRPELVAGGAAGVGATLVL